jgi:ring-1,2-phenylacetyl-CoA epoxidase subunit PaaA
MAIEPVLGRHEVATPDDFKHMPAEYQDLAKHLMLVHTEGELTGADDYTQVFYSMAPNAYERKICCERAVEEMAHYELSAQVLSDIGVDTSYMLAQHFSERPYYANELVRGVRNWMERGIFSFLGESVVLEHLLELKDCSYQPFARIFEQQIIKDEHVHVAHGFRIVREACQTAEGRVQAQAALDRLWPHILALFGSEQSSRSRDYVKWGLRKTLNGELRASFRQKIVPKLSSMGLSVEQAEVGVNP